ncbi:LysR family transcriptional regulator [Sphingomonas lacunae]|uniref:LysR family transcriptional regulator n=1 Tax=Sphingomonas lacunae TaxID=2698828 RepID=A0A6M4AQP8_9SPHN|nr:LysR substrate-binding domain-containing protein [Sphingomonas lacunae]QJQ31363.1 LysR family transcriptional regulator [Sphingomonas lacunae]
MKPGFTINRSQLDGIDAFLRVAHRRSFTAAARDLGVSPSAISQTIRQLEERVGVPLLMRTTRSVGLTQAGELFLEQALPGMETLQSAFEAARNLGERPAGLLRINLPRAVMPHLIEPALAGFTAAYPDIELELFAEDNLIDLAEAGFDAGIRPGEMLQADMVAVRLTEPFRLVVVGTPDYFSRHGHPQLPSELNRHRCVRLRGASGALANWDFVDGNRTIDVAVKGPVIVNDYAVQITIARTGVALAHVAEPNVIGLIEEGVLETTLDEYAIRTDGLFLYYPSRAQVMPKLRAFIDFVRAGLPPRSGRSLITRADGSQ